MFKRLKKNRRGQIHIDYIIGAALFILVVAAVALSTFQTLSPFYLAARADQLGMVSDNIAQTLLSSLGNPPDWGNESSLPEDFQLGLTEHDPEEYPNTGGMGFYSLDPTKLSRLSPSNPYFIPYGPYYSGFSEEILDLDSNFYNMSPSEHNSLSSLGLSNYRFRLLTRPPYQLVITAEPYQLALYPLESSFLLRIKSLTWDDVPIPNVQYRFAIMNPKGSASKFLSAGQEHRIFTGTTDAKGEGAVPVRIKFSPGQPQGVYVITAVSRTTTGLMSFCFTPFNVFVIDPAFKVVTYTRRLSSYSSQVVAHVWNITRTPAVLINSELQSRWRISIKATVFQPNGSAIGPSDMQYNAGGFWIYDFRSPLAGPYLSFVSVNAVNMTIYNVLVDLVEKIEDDPSVTAEKVTWKALSLWLAYQYTGEFLNNATRQISKEDKTKLGWYSNPSGWWTIKGSWTYNLVSLCTYTYTIAYWTTGQEEYLQNATIGGNELVEEFKPKWVNRTIATNSFAVLSLSTLYMITSNSTYLDFAVKAAGWLKENWETGPYDRNKEYDVGAATWAFMTLYQATGNESYHTLAQKMAYWLATQQCNEPGKEYGSWPKSGSWGGGEVERTSLPLIGLVSTWNYTFYQNVTAALNWLLSVRSEVMDAYKLSAIAMAFGFINAYIVPPFGYGYVSYPMMADYGPKDIQYKDTVALTRYVTIRGTVYQALLHCWDPEIQTSKTALSASCVGMGVFAASPVVYLVSKRAYKKGRVLKNEKHSS